MLILIGDRSVARATACRELYRLLSRAQLTEWATVLAYGFTGQRADDPAGTVLPFGSSGSRRVCRDTGTDCEKEGDGEYSLEHVGLLD